jgi:hypothetical protein
VQSLGTQSAVFGPDTTIAGLKPCATAVERISAWIDERF